MAFKSKGKLNILNLNNKNNKRSNLMELLNSINYLGILIILNLIVPILPKNKKYSPIRNLDIQTSEIIIKIKGLGWQRIMSNKIISDYYCPDVYLNDELIGQNTCVVSLNNSINILKLKWDIELYEMTNFFSGLTNLIEVDLTNFNSTLVTTMENTFKDCKYLEFVNISSDNLFDTSSVNDMQSMFEGCESLKSLDLSSFNTKSVEDMNSMFKGCTNLLSLNLSNFNTELVTNMEGMFYSCKSLKSLNISSFKTNSVNNMGYMFAFCESLTSLDLSQINTEQVTGMSYMFRNCLSLQSLDLSSFITPSVEEIYGMFYSCESLSSLNIENFITSKIVSTYNLFTNCFSLKTLNLSNFDTSNINYMKYTFEGCKSLKSLDLSNFDTSKTQNMENLFKDCISLTSLDLSNFNLGSVTTMNNIFYNCQNLEFLNFSDAQQIREFSISNGFKGTPKNLVYCINNAEIIVNAILGENSNSSISECSDKWREKQLKYIVETNECIDDCKNTEHYKYQYGNKCYSDCPNGTKYSIKHEYLCININDHENENFAMDDKTYEMNSGDNEIESNNKCHAYNFFQNECKIDSKDIDNRDDMIKRIRNEIMDGSMDNLLLKVLKENKNFLIQDNNEIYEIKALSNSNKISPSQNISTSLIDFSECEKILKKEYNIENDDELILFMIEYYVPEFKIPLIEYEIFSSDGKIKLNLDYCNNLSIPVYIPVSIDENEMFKYDPSSDFYKDFCFPYTTEDNTDITLYDRKNDFNNQNLSLCENNCKYKGYNFENKNAECECQIKNNLKFPSEIKVEPNKLLNKFTDIKKLSNFGVIKCYKLLFNKNGLIKNVGSYILLLIILLTIINTILFCLIGYKKLYNKINQIFQAKFLKNDKNKYQYEVLSQNNKINNIKNNNENLINNQDNNKNINIPPKKKIKIKRKIKRKKSIEISIFNSNSNSKSQFEIKKKINKDNKINQIIDNEDNKEKEEEKIDYEINSLSYEDALKYDKRTYLQYYISLIKTKQLIIFTFYPINDYNSRIIKICLFLFSFSLYYTVNAFFFNDATMHQIYIDKGSFNFIYQIPQILYSTIISAVIKKILTFLSLTEKNLIEIKSQKNFELGVAKMKKILKCLYIKFTLFFIFDFLFHIIFWYYISCFCVVYKNTQMYLIKDTIISFGTSLLYPIGINIIPGFLRIPSLKAKNKDKKCLYTISKVLQIF